MITTNCECVTDPAALTLIQGPYYGINMEKIKAEILAELAGSGGTGDAIVPDLQIGKETKMPMRMYGKQVYGTLFDFGALPNNGYKSLPHGISDVDWIQVSDPMSHISNTIDETIHTVNCPTNYAWYTIVSKIDVRMHTYWDRRAYSAVLCLLYTKASETAVI